MITEWTKGMSAEEAERFKNSFKSSKMVLDRLMELLIEYENKIDRDESNITVYDNPNWAFRQAHFNGDRSRLNKIKTLINPDQEV